VKVEEGSNKERKQEYCRGYKTRGRHRKGVVAECSALSEDERARVGTISCRVGQEETGGTKITVTKGWGRV